MYNLIKVLPAFGIFPKQKSKGCTLVFAIRIFHVQQLKRKGELAARKRLLKWQHRSIKIDLCPTSQLPNSLMLRS